tara:strand:+ start:12560 stop:13105 length:546 start_codon:yes stop_codon:yes gene_type:complete
MKIAVAATSAAATISQANMAEDRANAQLADEFTAASSQLDREYSESQRKIAEAQDEDFEGKSDAIRAANKALGTMRATETALTDSSLGTLMFEEAYGNALNYSRLDKTGKRKVMALESEKFAAQQSYISRTTLASNQNANLAADLSARRTGAMLGVASSGLNIYASAKNQSASIAAIEGTG